MRDICIILHDIRSCHNVGSLLRTADGMGVTTVYITGITPYPTTENDTRLPHISNKLSLQIQKTALGAENSQQWKHHESIHDLISELKAEGYQICALEQNSTATPLHLLKAPQKVAVLLGREVEGIDDELLQQANILAEIPMFGSKESFNVVQAAAMCLYQLRFMK